MKKHGPKRTLTTKYLYCNKHGECEHVEAGIKVKKWKCCACAVLYSAKYRINKKKKAVEYKGGQCELCGYNKFIGALTFHHINPLFKSFSLAGAGMQKRWDTLKKELDKCQLLCVNCHFELHGIEDMNNAASKLKAPTNYHKKLIHEINSKRLGKKPSL